MQKIPKFDNHRAFNKAVGPEKKSEIINEALTFIPDYKAKLYTICLHELFNFIHFQ